MSNNYDAIYQAFSNELSYLRPYVMEVFGEAQRPSVLFRPTIQPDGNQWCALYGKDLHDGVAGFGDTPEAAMRDFDKNWREETRPTLTKPPEQRAAGAP